MIEQNSPTPVKVAFSVPAAASTTTIGQPFQSFGPADKLVIFAQMQGMSAGTLDLYIQETWDGGTTWYDVAHFTQLAANAAQATTRIVTDNPSSATPTTIGQGTNGVAGVALAANKFVDSPWGPLLRIVSVTGVGVNAGAVTQNFTLIPWQQSH